jgi:acyl transferase domain-containing protein
VKSNIGHPQQAAGVAGVIKVVLSLQHQMLPRTLHADEPSPYIDWESGSVRLLTEPVAWPAGERPRRAGVSSFGLSGTNAHFILQESPAGDAAAVNEGADQPAVPVLVSEMMPWVMSGHSAAGLAAQAERLAAHVAARPGLAAGDVAWSLVRTRSALRYGAVVVGRNRGELTAGLAAVARGVPAPGVLSGVASAGGLDRVVFVFPGQGSQWAGMGRELLGCCPVFARRLAECGAALAPYVDWDLLEVIAEADGTPDLERVDVVQPVLWAVMVSLAAVWQAAGVVPNAVVGHSQGEIAAAVVAGMLSLEDGAKVVALRSQALVAVAGQGAMISVAASAPRVREMLAAWGDRLSLAVVNGPEATVVSGEVTAVEEFAGACAAAGLRSRILPVSYASHCAQVEQLRPQILAALAGIVPGAGRVPMVSAMTGEFLAGPELDGGYWYDSLRAPVEFDRAVRVLAEAGHWVFVEASPHPVLVTAVTETLEDAADGSAGAGSVVSGTLRRDEGGPERLLASLAEVYVRGVVVDWAAVLGGGQVVDLPTYAFQRRRYWPDVAVISAAMAQAISPVGGNGPGSAAETRFWAAVDGGDLQAVAETLDVTGQPWLGEVVSALASWRRKERKRTEAERWRYRISWAPITQPGPAALDGNWVVLTPDGADCTDLARACAAAMAAHGAQVMVIEAGAMIADRAVIADLAGAIEQSLLAGAAADGPAARGVAGVLSLLALQEAPSAEFPAVTEGLAGTQALLQALGGIKSKARLWVATRGAVAAGEREAVTSPVQTQAWGMGRVAGIEYPNWWGGLVDLPSALDERAAKHLVTVLAGCGEDQVAIRAAGILGRRLERAQVRRGGPVWAPHGTALVTGGTGAIGGHVARWLAGRGAPRVVLASRSGPAAAGVAATAAALATAGTGVTVAACDSARREPLAGLVDWIGRSGPPLTAVVHTAGAGQSTAIADTTLAELAAVLAAKAGGAALLDEVTEGIDLDAFVLFSSAAATWGSSAQPAYAAANAYLDGLASARRSRGLAATSVAWGLWSGGGMGSGEGAHFERHGLLAMDPELAVRALGQALDGGETQLTIADVDWARFAPPFTLRRPSPLIGNLPEVPQILAEVYPSGPQQTEAAAELVQRLARLPLAEQEQELQDLIRRHTAEVLGHPSPEGVDVTLTFIEQGLESLTGLDLRKRLTGATGLHLPVTLVFDRPTPEALARHLHIELADPIAAATEAGEA